MIQVSFFNNFVGGDLVLLKWIWKDKDMMIFLFMSCGVN